MTPVTQTILADPANPHQQGNCLQAAVASMLEMPLDEVPHFVQADHDTDGDINWLAYLHGWLRERGWRLDTHIQPGEVHLGAGPSPRGHGIHHIAIYRDDELLHDPHPDGTGVLDARTRWVLRRCDPVPMRDRLRALLAERAAA